MKTNGQYITALEKIRGDLNKDIATLNYSNKIEALVAERLVTTNIHILEAIYTLTNE